MKEHGAPLLEHVQIVGDIWIIKQEFCYTKRGRRNTGLPRKRWKI